jgi:hypothetical protein
VAAFPSIKKPKKNEMNKKTGKNLPSGFFFAFLINRPAPSDVVPSVVVAFLWSMPPMPAVGVPTLVAVVVVISIDVLVVVG